MMHVKTYKYAPNKWLTLPGFILFLIVTIGAVWVAIKEPIPPFIPMDILLTRRLGPVFLFGAFSIFLMVPAYRSLLGTRLLLGKDRILIPQGASSRSRIEVNYADIVCLRVAKVFLPGRSTYFMQLTIEYRFGWRTRCCALLRNNFRPRKLFEEMGFFLAENVRVCNPGIMRDPDAIQLAPR